MTTRTQFEQAVYIATAAGADIKLDKLLERNKKKSGRPSKVSSLVFIVGVLLVAMHRRRATVADIALVLNSLPNDWLKEIGHKMDGVAPDELYGYTRRLGAAADYTAERAPHLTQLEREEVREALQQFTLRILAPTLITLPKNHGTYAIDATDLESFDRKIKKPSIEEMNAQVEKVLKYGEPAAPEREPATNEHGDNKAKRKGAKGPSDARWGRRTSKSPGQKHEIYMGYAGHGIVLTPEPKGRVIPAQVVHLIITPANGDPIDASLRMLRDLVDAGTSIQRLLGDRAYSNATFQRWHKHLIDMNIAQVAEPRKDEYKFKRRQGIPYLFGEPYCPGTPTQELNITPENQVITQNERHARQEVVKRLDPFRLVPKGKLKSDGSMRRGCPVGSVACPLKEGTLSAVSGTQTPIVTNPPSIPHRVCLNNEIVIRLESEEDQTVLKLHQELRIGTPEHTEFFNARTSVERYFSQFKWHGRFTRDVTQLRGLGAITVVASIFAAFSNLLLLESAQKRDKKYSDHPLIAIKEDVGEPMRPHRSRHSK